MNNSAALLAGTDTRDTCNLGMFNSKERRNTDVVDNRTVAACSAAAHGAVYASALCW